MRGAQNKEKQMPPVQNITSMHMEQISEWRESYERKPYKLFPANLRRLAFETDIFSNVSPLAGMARSGSGA